MKNVAQVRRCIEKDDVIGLLKLRIVEAYIKGNGVHISAQELAAFAGSGNGDWIEEYISDVLGDDEDERL